MDVPHAPVAGGRGSAHGLHGAVPGRAAVPTVSLPTQLRRLAPPSSLSPGLATRACGLPVASRAGPPLARGASGPPWQGVRQGVQRGVSEPVPARGGAVVGGKGRLIFLYNSRCRFGVTFDLP